MLTKLVFPQGFYWGSSTSAHQVEGGNFNDWTEWEKKNAGRLAREAKVKWQGWQIKKFPEMFRPENYISGNACDHYNRYEEDFDIARSLGHNAHRFSIEWSRIEPKEGEFNEEEIDHYRKVIKALKKRGLEPFVTLWHWTNPLWIRDMGGWENKKTVEYFSRYVGKIASKLGKEVKFWITINEPTVYLSKSYLVGAWPPQKRSFLSFNRACKNLAKAHVRAYKTIHGICPNAKAGFANNLSFIEPRHWYCLADWLVAKIYKYFSFEKIYKLTNRYHDFIALQYYFHDTICFYNILLSLLSSPRRRGSRYSESTHPVPGSPRQSTGQASAGMTTNLYEIGNEQRITDLNWEIYPEGIYHILKDLRKYDKPIYITENGLADKDDKSRKKFIEENLFWVHKAIAEGVDVRGYFYWSLLDNFEWDKGFWPRFGLVSVDRKTQKRTVRKSALEYAKICKTSTLATKHVIPAPYETMG
ncbi:MAG: glycoside hydrolase family 1 protein [Candidatus Moranbacteria bacterium]|nr:glycoside hydrolase family 1 protein [Candidatus Moranbacteria bacterium]